MFKSIKFMTTAFIALLGILSILAFGSFSYHQAKTNMENKYLREAELILTHQINEFRDEFESTEKILETLTKSGVLFQDSKGIGEQQTRIFLETLQKNLPNSMALYAGFENG